ncbi:hypothetical protein JD523_02195 [Aeromonas enteropelogenes]|uniref:hypothetical protein n=1 Tax=Aeromonas enteropelogenes TaxID=29489 RepID=UPI0019200D5B|nr:hypothetical protein [Aeromonas enteropelogenes]MBL0519721.1 hypothetical protein [Aeromonas enteropelogenes]
MDDLQKTIKLRCTFCHSEQFAIPYSNYTPPCHSFVVCANCGRENDVTSLLITAKSKGFLMAQDYAEELIDKMKADIAKSFKNSKFIRIK